MSRSRLEALSRSATSAIWFAASRSAPGSSDQCIRRSPAFWFLLPFQALFAIIVLPFCMLFSLGDLREEPNNHAVVVRKPSPR
jgi:hypothetical protein